MPAVTPAVRPLPLKPPVALPDYPPAPGPDAADVLVSQVEALYKAGMADYGSGNLEGAKEQFDQAVEKLLESKLDVQGDDRLSGEFDKLVEDVYAAEAAALERGDTLSPHNYVPSPLESFSGLTFPVDPRIKQQAQQEVKAVRSDLPLVSNDYVDGVLTYFQNRGRGYITTALKRLGIYQPIISGTLRKEGIPQDLIYLAALESAFNPYALSREGAKGIWQFMLGTGMLYGLKKDRWVDEREDPVKSTQAAARHLKDLYQMFGDWSLAMAAYDSGPLTVQGAVERTGYADYWTLRRLHALPTETEDYVPIFMATLMIAKDPKAYGFD
ncbi:MAG: lytic transglycosylase domain-containing protein, partial [Terriglobia bacterium]